MERRTPLGRVRGFGSAKDGTRHWLAQRFTAVALVPLTLWFVVAMISMATADYADAVAWVGSPTGAVLWILFIVAVFHHGQLGLQVVIEDYIAGDGVKILAIVAIKFTAIVLAGAAVLAVLRLAVGST